MSDLMVEAPAPGSADPPDDSGSNAEGSLTDEQHDWATTFTGIHTRADASESDTDLQSASDSAIATSSNTTGNDQPGSQNGTGTPDPSYQSNDPNTEDSDLMLDPKSGQSAGFTKTPAEVEKEVTDKFGKYIPKDQLANPASKVTNFQDNTTFQNDLKIRHPDLEKNGIDPNGVVGESYEGKIYINKDKADIGTAYHEQLHHYSNKKFKSSFGVVSGVKFNEGVTEYLTRKTYSGDRSGHYDTEEQLAEAVAKKVGDDVLVKAYFQGDDDAMRKVSDALAGK